MCIRTGFDSYYIGTTRIQKKLQRLTDGILELDPNHAFSYAIDNVIRDLRQHMHYGAHIIFFADDYHSLPSPDRAAGLGEAITSFTLIDIQPNYITRYGQFIPGNFGGNEQFRPRRRHIPGRDTDFFGQYDHLNHYTYLSNNIGDDREGCSDYNFEDEFMWRVDIDTPSV